MRSRSRRLLARAGPIVLLGLLGAGPPAPIALRTPEGGEARIERDAAGPDLVLHFWASWCPECSEELPALGRAAQACDPTRVRVIAVNVDEAPELARSFMAERGISLPLLLAPKGRAWRGAGLWGMPSNLLWTRDGVRTQAGASSEQRWRDQLRGLGCAAGGASPQAGE